MAKACLKRHISPIEVALTAEWIMKRPDTPSWQEVREFVLAEIGIDRTVEALRRVAELKKARMARSVAPKILKQQGPRPTTRKVNILQRHIDNLEVEVQRLRQENSDLFERNLRLINGARVHRITEGDLDRHLAPINRNPTNLTDARKRS